MLLLLDPIEHTTTTLILENKEEVIIRFFLKRTLISVKRLSRIIALKDTP